MSTPTPHVPITLLLAGGVGVFSRDCAVALLECNLNPEWIGPYHVVRARRLVAVRAVAAWQQAELRGGPPVPRPSFEERWLAASTAGHLAQDAAHRHGRRGDHCATLVDGYTEAHAAAMPTLGSSNIPETVEGAVSARERDLAHHRRNTATPPGSEAYPAHLRREDQNECIRVAVQAHVRNFPDGLRHTPHPRDVDAPPLNEVERSRLDAHQAAARAAAAADPRAALGPVGTPGSSATSTGPERGAVPLISPTTPGSAAIEQAIECRQGYRDARLAAIEEAIADENRGRDDLERQRSHARTREEHLRRVDHAQRAEAEANERVRAAWKKADDHDREYFRHADPDARRQCDNRGIRDVLRRIDNAEREYAVRQATTRSALTALQRHDQRTPDGQIACLEAQRARILAGTPHTVGRIPEYQSP